MADVPTKLRTDVFLKGSEGFDNIKVVAKQPADVQKGYDVCATLFR